MRWAMGWWDYREATALVVDTVQWPRGWDANIGVMAYWYLPKD